VQRPSPFAGSLVEVAVIVLVCFGWFIVGSLSAVAAGFPATPIDDQSFVGIIAYEVVFAGTALALLHFRGRPLVSLMPRPTAMGSLVGLTLYGLTLVATWPLALVFSAQQVDAQPIQQMVGAASISLPALAALSIVNGIYEETFLNGYLVPALQSFGAAFAVGVSVLVRVLYHLYQGPLGALAVLFTGIIFGVYFWKTRKLWPVAFAHVFADLAAFALS